jgi:hypothetical protein
MGIKSPRLPKQVEQIKQSQLVLTLKEQIFLESGKPPKQTVWQRQLQASYHCAKKS